MHRRKHQRSQHGCQQMYTVMTFSEIDGTNPMPAISTIVAVDFTRSLSLLTERQIHIVPSYTLLVSASFSQIPSLNNVIRSIWSQNTRKFRVRRAMCRFTSCRSLTHPKRAVPPARYQHASLLARRHLSSEAKKLIDDVRLTGLDLNLP